MTPADTEQAARDLEAMVALVAQRSGRGIEVRIYNGGKGIVELKPLKWDNVVTTEHLLKAALGE